MNQISKYIISVSLLLGMTMMQVNAQSLVWPSAVRAGFDVSRLGISLVDPNRTQYEFTADIDIYKYFLTFDYGHWKTDSLDGIYNMDGNYLRAGIDYNFLYSDPDNHVIFFGLRYCRSNFNEEFNFPINDPYYGSHVAHRVETGNSANWMEVNAGIKVHVWKELYMGWTGRLKFGLKLHSPGDFESYEIPGYGTTTKNSNWGLNYILYYRIPFRNKPAIPQKQPKKK
jgi:hypothetical protein